MRVHHADSSALAVKPRAARSGIRAGPTGTAAKCLRECALRLKTYLYRNSSTERDERANRTKTNS
jgi:hypothetical protein